METTMKYVDPKVISDYAFVDICHQNCDKVLVLHVPCLLQTFGLQGTEDFALKRQLLTHELRSFTVKQVMMQIFKMKKLPCGM